MISFIAPIIIDNSFLGIVGIDMSLSTIDKIADSFTAFNGSARTYIISNNGVITGVTGEADLIGKNLSNSTEPLHSNPDEIIDDIKQGRRFTRISGDYLVSQSPVFIGNTDSPWAVQVFVPVEEVTRNATMLVYGLCILSIICLFAGLMLFSYAARQIAEPIIEISSVARSIADGDLSRDVPSYGKDEVGQLRQSFQQMIVSLREKEQLESDNVKLLSSLIQKNKELETIVYAASHDLRAPLINIVGFAERLRKNCDILSEVLLHADLSPDVWVSVFPVINDKIPRSLDFIRTSAKKMDNLVAGLLQLSRIGRTILIPEEINMNSLIKSVIDGFAMQIQNASATITITPLPPCTGDISQINRLFSNLIDNSLKYRSPVRPLMITISGHISGDMAVYSVEDTGIGIPAEYLDKIWILFQRVSIDPKVEGEGLGLTLVHRIVEKHGGKITVESKVDQGTRFIIQIPHDISFFRQIDLEEEKRRISILPPPPLRGQKFG